MPPARRVLGISWDFVAEAEPITVRNRSAGGKSGAVRAVIHADRSAPGDGSADADGALRSNSTEFAWQVSSQETLSNYNVDLSINASA